MWNRKELKAKGKAAFKANYWKSVFITLLVGTLIAGGTGAAGGLTFSNIFNLNGRDDKVQEAYDRGYEEGYDDGMYGSFYDGDGYDNEWGDGFDDPDDWIYDFGGDDLPDVFNDYTASDNSDVRRELLAGNKKDVPVFGENGRPGIRIEGLDDLTEMFGALDGAATTLVLGVIIIIILVATVFAVALSLLYEALIINPMEVGRKRFYLLNTGSKAAVGEVARAFDTNYGNVAKVLFFRSLYTLLWSLLFVIPGIVKHYEYLMMPYIMSEDPNISKDQAFAISKAMMSGNKWKTFVLDLSFIGWFLLSMITLGIVGIFYVNPYFDQTKAELYLAIKEEYAARFAHNG